MKRSWTEIVIAIGILAGVLTSLYAISRGDPTANETVLLSVLLTVLATLGSWIATRHYAQAAFQTSLRIFALKAAEKVGNLSDELERLTGFLQRTLDEEYASPVESLLARDLRIESAIHVLGTLKSVNDLSLSDWQGVLGEELEAQREEREEREEELRELVERIESIDVPRLLQASDQASLFTDFSGALAVQDELRAARSEIRSLAAQVGGLPMRRSRKGSKQKIDVQSTCPNCSETMRYRQSARPRSFVSVRCKNCQQHVVSSFSEGAFSVQLRREIEETVDCPTCDESVVVFLDVMPGGKRKELCCSTCSSLFRVTRAADEVRVRMIEGPQTPEPSTREPLSDQVLEAISEAMPEQPWPSGAHRTAAESLGIPLRIVRRAVDELIRRGVFQVQIEGKLYAPVEDEADTDSESSSESI